jgi:hypothetical protein
VETGKGSNRYYEKKFNSVNKEIFMFLIFKNHSFIFNLSTTKSPTFFPH